MMRKVSDTIHQIVIEETSHARTRKYCAVDTCKRDWGKIIFENGNYRAEQMPHVELPKQVTRLIEDVLGIEGVAVIVLYHDAVEVTVDRHLAHDEIGLRGTWPGITDGVTQALTAHLHWYEHVQVVHQGYEEAAAQKAEFHHH
jgi:hypothetical protein